MDGTPDGAVRELAAFALIKDIKARKPFLWSRGDVKPGSPDPAAPSAFDQKKYVAEPNSPLAAVSDGATIRVYFQRASSKDLTVAYTESAVQKPSLFVWKDRVARKGSESF